MNEMRWIIVRNWGRFQHPDALRGEGIPPWFKVYTKLSHNPDFESLTELERGILLTIWVEYASSDGQLTVTGLSKACHARVRTRTLERLNQAGFIGLSASRPQAESKQRASLEKIRKEEPPSPPSGNNRNGRHRQEAPTLINVVDACQHFIEGWGWDETFTEHMMLEEFHRISKSHRTEGSISAAELQGLKEQWKATRQDRYGIKANLTA